MEEYKIDPNIAYDVVELPTKGVFYNNKKKSVRVSYLTAADENILSSPNLIESNTVIEELLKRKILDKDFIIDEMVEEDRQAILIFLRNTAFGTTYKFKSTDPKTGEEFEVQNDDLEKDKIALWQFRSASPITGIDFSYSSVSREQFFNLFEEV